jgi:hypothetical protein
VTGGTASFNVAASGSTPLTYQWRLNGSPISGATGSSYSKSNVTTNDAGTYSVLVTNAAGQATSSGAVLKVFITPAVTWSAPANITYGTPLGAAQLNASSLVAGSFAYNPTAGTVLNAGNSQTLSATFNPTDTNTYVSVATNVSINVLKAPLTVTAANTNKVYGAPLPSFAAIYSGFTNGDTTARLSSLPGLSCSATPTSPVGSYPIQVSGGVSSNYAFSLVNGTLAVTPATPVLTWTNPSPISYGTALSSTQLNASANIPGSFAYAPTNGVVLNCGTNTLSVAFSPTDSLDYNSVTGNVAQVVLLIYDGVNISDPTQAGADPDGDGLANLAEYALGTDPHNPADAQTGMTISLTNNSGNSYLVLKFKRRHDTTAFPLLYIPEVSADALNWFSDNSHATQTSVVTFDAQFDWVTVQDTTPVTATAPRFVRLRVAEN